MADFNQTPADGALAVTLPSLTVGTASNGALGSWSFTITNFPEPSGRLVVNLFQRVRYLGDLEDVEITDPQAGNRLRFDGFFWRNVIPSTPDPDPDPDPTDPYFANVSLLLPMDGANGSTVFTDASSDSRAVTANGNAQISTTRSKFGGASGAFDGVGDYLSIGEISVGALEDCTLECFFYHIDGEGIFGTPFNFNWQLLTVFGGKLYAYWNGTDKQVEGGVVTSNTWHHAAITRQAGVIRLFLNGVLVSTSTGTSTNNFTIQWIGRTSFRNDFSGYFDQVRITKGVARYTTSFTPPAAPFPTAGPPATDPYFANVSLLLSMDGSDGSNTFTDASSNSLTVAVNGGAVISTTNPKFGSGCALLDGSGDYLGAASSALFNVGGGTPFTVECFVRRAGTAAGAVLSMRNTGIYAPFELISTGSNLQLLSGNAALSSWPVNLFAGTGTLPLDEYAHVALVGDGANLRVYVNGTQVISATQAGWASANYPLYIGGGGDNQFNGRIDEVRFTLNVARYTANFTPPTGPFPTS